MKEWDDDTQIVSVEHYLTVRDRYFVFFTNNPDVVRFGSYGSIGSPGLSDLDLIVVVKNQALTECNFKLPDVQEDEKYIFIHPPMVVPESLLKNLFYYHLVNVTWAGGQRELPCCVDNDFEMLGCLHVLKKTLYVQSVLWDLLIWQRKCRRAFLALTSLVRSIEWLDSFNFSVKITDKFFAKSLLDLRKKWIKPKSNKSELLPCLENLLYSGLEIAIILPERISSYMLAIKNKRNFHPNHRSFQLAPLNFLIEDNVMNAKEIIFNVLHKMPYFRYARCFMKFQPIINGTFAIVGPQTFTIMTSKLPEAVNYSMSIGQKIWGDAQDITIHQAVKSKLWPLLRKEFQINKEFGELLSNAGLFNCYMGNLWMIPSLKGFILRFFGKTLGRTGYLRFLQNVEN